MWEYAWIYQRDVDNRWVWVDDADPHFAVAGPAIEALNEMGQRNWELCGLNQDVTGFPPKMTYYFKRPVSS